MAKKRAMEGLPCGPVAETPSSQCRGQGFDSWSGNYIPHANWHAPTKNSHAATEDPTCRNEDPAQANQ